MRALLSVSDKEGIVEFAKGLEELGWQILSTGGTYKLLKSEGVKATEVSEFTGSPEMFEGRVKTLHPKIHGGILHKRDDATHVAQAKEYGIEGIDLVCVNLYPFKETTIRTDDFAEIIENIDIGGPAMVRSAAKNFKDVLIVKNLASHDKSSITKTAIKSIIHIVCYRAVVGCCMLERLYHQRSSKLIIIAFLF